MKSVLEMTDDEAFEKLSVSLNVGGKDMRIGLLPAHAEIKLWKPCNRTYTTRDGEVVKCRKKKSPHYCEPRVAIILDAWKDLRLVKPPHLDHPYELLHWNEEKIHQLYGTVVADEFHGAWVRNYQLVYIVGTRGGFKTVFMGGNALVLLANVLPGTEMVLLSQTEQRTEETLGGYMEQMLNLSPALQDAGVQYLKSKMKFVRHEEKYPPVECAIMTSRIGGTVLGRRISMFFIDEFDATINMPQFLSDAMYSWGIQPEPIGMMASTVAKDYASFEAERTEKMRDVLEKPWLEPRTIPVLNIAEEGENWRDREVWHKTNFHIGLGLLDPATLDMEYLRAEGNPELESEFARFRVGVRISPHTSYIPMSVYDACHQKQIEFGGLVSLADIENEMKLWPVFIGVDYGEVSDWTAAVGMCMNGNYEMLLRGKFWIPKSNIEFMDKKLAGHVSKWIASGHLQVMEDRDVGIEQVAHEIAYWSKTFPHMMAIGYDQAKALAARTVWENKGIYCDSVAQGHRIQEGALEIKYRAMEHKLIHGGDPVLRYFFDSAELKTKTMDNKEIVKPERNISARRVDGAVAAATAVYMRLLHNQYAPHAGLAGNTSDIRWKDLGDEYDEDETAHLTLY